MLSVRPYEGLAQEGPRAVVSVAYTPLIKTILRFDSIQIVQTPLSRLSRQLFDLSKDGYTDHHQHLLRVGDGLSLFLSGTGKLYESDALPQGDSLRFRRIDSTRLECYNLCAYVFPHRGRIHNLGGYGFWHWNGQLRAFNRRMREWEIVPLNREVPVAMGSPECFAWHDMRRERIYMLRAIMGNEAVKGEIIRLDEEARLLDLATGEWSPLGVHTDHIRKRLDESNLLAASDTGLVMVFHNSVEYWLPAENRILTLSDFSPLAEITTRVAGKVTWMRNGWLYTGNPGIGTVDSLVLHTGMFRDSGERIYRSRSIVSWQYLAVVLSAAGMVFLLGGLVSRATGSWLPRRDGEIVGEGVDTPPLVGESADGLHGTDEPPATPLRSAVFDEVERALLGLLIRNATEGGRRTTSQEINRVLGVGSKSLDMQKRKRSDVIRAINRKYLLVRPDGAREPIVKERGDLDARLTEYSLHPDELQAVATLLDMP